MKNFILFHVDACTIRMSIEKSFKQLLQTAASSQEKILPSPHGTLSLLVPSRALAAATKEVTRVQQQQQQRLVTVKQRGRYNKYSPKE